MIGRMQAARPGVGVTRPPSVGRPAATDGPAGARLARLAAGLNDSPAQARLARIGTDLNMGPAPAVASHAPGGHVVVQMARSKRKPDRHGRKAAALAKHEGTIFDDRPDPREAVGEPEAEPPAEAVTKTQIAREFSDGLKALGLKPFLSGGAALAWQGGKRPVSDLDFRIATEDAGFASFDEPKGQAVLKAINHAILGKSRDDHAQIRGGVANAFAPVGGGALTVGTDNWFGVECSLSITSKAPRGLRGLPIGVQALGPEAIQADKLKAMITRTKRGDASVGKVANDLFDFLDATRLIDQERASSDSRSTHPDPEIRALHDQLDAQQPRKSAARRNFDRSPARLSMAEHVDRAARARLDEYRKANLEGQSLDHLDDAAVVKRMGARAVLTALAHGKPGGGLKGGPRGRAFGKVADAPSKRSLTELASLPVSAEDTSELRPCMAEWNQGPDFGPRRRGGPAPAPAAVARGPTPDEILAQWPDGAHETRLIAAWRRDGKAGQIAAIRIIKILVLEDGFRPLRDSHNPVDTELAFGLGKTAFSNAYKFLSGEGFVRGEPDGLYLTDAGRRTFPLRGDAPATEVRQ